jgi:hypothetical protein
LVSIVNVNESRWNRYRVRKPLSLNAQTTWHRQVEEQLKHLPSLAPITAAEVVLAWT